jgi:hypothetical protein
MFLAVEQNGTDERRMFNSANYTLVWSSATRLSDNQGQVNTSRRRQVSNLIKQSYRQGTRDSNSVDHLCSVISIRVT